VDCLATWDVDLYNIFSRRLALAECRNEIMEDNEDENEFPYTHIAIMSVMAVSLIFEQLGSKKYPFILS